MASNKKFKDIMVENNQPLNFESTKSEMARKKREAVYLFIVKGYSQKEISKILKVSAVTISAWATKYKWNDKVTNDVNKSGGLDALMLRFFDFVQSVKPESVASFKNLWGSFLKAEQNKTF